MDVAGDNYTYTAETSLVLHWLPAASAITTDASDRIDTWTDEASSLDLLPVGGGEAKDPQYAESGAPTQNGITIPNFLTAAGDPTGTGKSLKITASVPALLTGGNMIFIVAKITFSASSQVLLDVTDGSSNSLIKIDNSSTTQMTVINGKTANTLTWTPDSATERYAVFCLYRINTSSMAQIDDDDAETISNGQGDTLTTSNIRVGSLDPSASPWNNPIAELLFYNDFNSITNYLAVKEYLDVKYGLSLTIPTLTADLATAKKLHFDCSSDLAVADGKTNDNIDDFLDLTANNFDLDQPLSGNRPSMLTKVFGNGMVLPYLQFDGADEFLENGSGQTIPTAIGTGDGTWFWVGRVKFDAGEDYIMRFAVNSSTEDGFFLRIDTSNDFFSQIGSHSQKQVIPTSKVERDLIITWRRSGTSTFMQVDDDTEVTMSTIASDAAAATLCQMGAKWQDPGLDRVWNGHFMEFRWYDSLLSTADITTVKQHLDDKWALGVGF